MKILDKGFIELDNYLGDDKTVVRCARISYLENWKGDESDERLIESLLKRSHTSPFEQVEFSFFVKAPLFVTRQWMRHRTWSYSEVSRRYTGEGIEFYIPDDILKNTTYEEYAKEAITKNSESAYALYQEMVTRKVPRELARVVLPVNMYTTFYAKTDLNNLFKFIQLRNSKQAQYEIRLYAQAIEQLIEPIVPISYKYFKKLINERKRI